EEPKIEESKIEEPKIDTNKETITEEPIKEEKPKMEIKEEPKEIPQDLPAKKEEKPAVKKVTNLFGDDDIDLFSSPKKKSPKKLFGEPKKNFDFDDPFESKPKAKFSNDDDFFGTSSKPKSKTKKRTPFNRDDAFFDF